jgi:hypothetical protein
MLGLDYECHLLNIIVVTVTQQDAVYEIVSIGKRQSLWNKHQTNKQTLWPEPASELYRLSDYRLSAKLLPTFADRGDLEHQCLTGRK